MNKKKLLFAGDSITDADHLWDPGPDRLGCGYVHMIAEKLKSEENSSIYEFINSGFNGYRAEDLLRRWNQVCLSKQPDLVTLLVGVNEAGAAMEGMITEPEVFEKTYERLITGVLEDIRADMILMEPFLFHRPAYLLVWRQYLEPICQVIGHLAEKHSLPLILLDGPLNALADQEGVDQITVDGIHLTERGNCFLADQWIKAYRQMCR